MTISKPITLPVLPGPVLPGPVLPAPLLPATSTVTGFGELRAGHLGVRIANTEAERDAAQALRYRIFYGEMGATPDDRVRRMQRDVDMFDDVADHLLAQGR